MQIPIDDTLISSKRPVRVALGAAILLALAAGAKAATWYAANDGLDGAGCGAKESPCRSITQVIGVAAPGDRIVVGPGRYGDLDSDGVLGEVGEETPAPGCGCMLAVNKPLSVTSSDGAAVTVIDARSVDAPVNVALFMTGGEFGRPRKGFTVTNPDRQNGTGIAIDSRDVSVRGNQLLRTGFAVPPAGGTAIALPFPQNVLVEGNQIVGWARGIAMDSAGNTARKNAFSLNAIAIASVGGTISGNVGVANNLLVSMREAPVVVGNAAYGCLLYGFALDTTFTGTLERNNAFGNGFCGLANGTNPSFPGVPGAIATNNFWGAATGPGADPADPVCDTFGGTTIVAPFATKPFKVKAPVKP